MSQLFIKGLSAVFFPFYQKFHLDLQDSQKAQNKVKNKVIQKLTKTAYGSKLKLKNLEDWGNIPIVDYDSLKPWIAQQRQQPNSAIITPEKIHFWECTSGSTGSKKWIPYTTSLLASFSNMFCIWAYDLISNGPAFSSGKTYLCISPEIGTTGQGIDDSKYLNPLLKWLLGKFLLRIKGHFSTVEDFRWSLACALLQAPDLETFSLWSPSFLTTQLDFIQTNNRQLQSCLVNKISSRRLSLLGESEINWSELWSELKLISCWDCNYAADSAEILKQYFPKVFLQGKGLLATEAPMTIPLIPVKGFIPLLNQVVFEFLTSEGEICNLRELEVGKTYELVISQLGGLSRYRIGDRIQVSHWYLNTPCLNFVGRGEQISDLVGEKLNIEFVRECLNNFLKWGFCCLVPVSGNPPHYCLLLEQAQEEEEEIIRKLETALQENFHYHKARQFGQLDRVKVIINPQVSQWLRGNKRLGDGKYPILVTKPLNLT
ncbi:GH3 family domain-containing protein [Cyanobacterium aponinum]|uniref:GH3 family domain-containing protein n=1 Tax=Cyanobacterium aponinum TaxID=379064 RepID=UPI000C12ADD0|nr:GH3 auxin-responsive promoter family protein [Cyanobacterium aponinum]PHV61255.1 hypothetical protein CSQ80_16445 [Cyanobacterium aponinum IPPAS B-1201]